MMHPNPYYPRMRQPNPGPFGWMAIGAGTFAAGALAHRWWQQQQAPIAIAVEEDDIIDDPTVEPPEPPVIQPDEPSPDDVAIEINEDCTGARAGGQYEGFISAVAEDTPAQPVLVNYLAVATFIVNELAPHCEVSLDGEGNPVGVDTPQKAAIIARIAADVVMHQEEQGRLMEGDADVLIVQIMSWGADAGANDAILEQTWSALQQNPAILLPALGRPARRSSPRTGLTTYRGPSAAYSGCPTCKKGETCHCRSRRWPLGETCTCEPISLAPTPTASARGGLRQFRRRAGARRATMRVPAIRRAGARPDPQGFVPSLQCPPGSRPGVGVSGQWTCICQPGFDPRAGVRGRGRTAAACPGNPPAPGWVCRDGIWVQPQYPLSIPHAV